MIFGLLPSMTAGDLPEPAPNAETSGWEVIHEPAGMAFDLHAAVVGRYLAGRVLG